MSRPAPSPAAEAARAGADLADRLHTGGLSPQDASDLAEMLAAWRARQESLAADWLARAGWLTRPQAAALLGVSPATLARWARAGDGPDHAAIGRRIYYSSDAIVAYLRDREASCRARRAKRAAR